MLVPEVHRLSCWGYHLYKGIQYRMGSVFWNAWDQNLYRCLDFWNFGSLSRKIVLCINSATKSIYCPRYLKKCKGGVLLVGQCLY
jgi:hypothetical protein